MANESVEEKDDGNDDDETLATVRLRMATTLNYRASKVLIINSSFPPYFRKSLRNIDRQTGTGKLLQKVVNFSAGSKLHKAEEESQRKGVSCKHDMQ